MAGYDSYEMLLAGLPVPMSNEENAVLTRKAQPVPAAAVVGKQGGDVVAARAKMLKRLKEFQALNAAA